MTEPTDRDRLIEAVARAIIAAGYNPATASDIATIAIRTTLQGIREPNGAQRMAGLIEHVKAIEADATKLQEEGRIDDNTAILMTIQSDEPVSRFYTAMIDRRIQDFAPEGKGE